MIFSIIDNRQIHNNLIYLNIWDHKIEINTVSLINVNVYNENISS